MTQLPNVPHKTILIEAIRGCFFQSFSQYAPEGFCIEAAEQHRLHDSFSDTVLVDSFFDFVLKPVAIEQHIFQGVHERLCAIDDRVRAFILEKRKAYRENPSYRKLSQQVRQLEMAGWTHYLDFLYEQLLIAIHASFIQRAKHDVYAYYLACVSKEQEFETDLSARGPNASAQPSGVVRGANMQNVQGHLQEDTRQMIIELFRNHPNLDQEINAFQQFQVDCLAHS